MPFNQGQLDALNAPLARGVVKSREQSGRTLSYVEGWHVIAEANRIFGFDGWSSETLEVHCVSEKDRLIGKAQKPGFGVTYTAKVRIIVDCDGEHVTREGFGSGHGIDADLGMAHESAIKEAETDGRKRALMTFGNPFGLALYDKQQVNVVDDSKPIKPAAQNQSIMPDDFTARVEYMVDCRDAIAALEPDQVVAWWMSDEQKEARRKHQLDQSQIDALKQAVMNRRDAAKKVAA